MHRLNVVAAISWLSLLASPGGTPCHAEGRKLAVVVGIDSYRITSGLGQLNFAAKDAAELATALRENGFTVDEMTHAVAREPGGEHLLPQADYLRDQFGAVLDHPNLGPLDAVVFALHGHGVQFDWVDEEGSKSPRFYFCPADATIAGLQTANQIEDHHRLLPLEELYQQLGDCKAGTRLLVIDACRNDPTHVTARTGLTSATLPKLPPPPGGAAAFFSCKPNQIALEDPKVLGRGVFTHFLVEGLRGRADQPLADGPADGVVTLAELSAYVANNTYAHSLKHYRVKQSPELRGDFDLNLPLGRVASPATPSGPVDEPAPTDISNPLGSMVSTCERHFVLLPEGSVEEVFHLADGLSQDSRQVPNAGSGFAKQIVATCDWLYALTPKGAVMTLNREETVANGEVIASKEQWEDISSRPAPQGLGAAKCVKLAASQESLYVLTDQDRVFRRITGVNDARMWEPVLFDGEPRAIDLWEDSGEVSAKSAKGATFRIIDTELEDERTGREPQPGQESSLTLPGGVIVRFCWAPSGRAKLGSPATEQQRQIAGLSETEFEYSTRGFWLAKYETTVEQWQAVMGERTSTDGRLPVGNKSFREIEAFVLRARSMADASELGTGQLRLPTEDEWEYACRGGLGNANAFYWGGAANGSEANVNGDYPYPPTTPRGLSRGKAMPVGSFDAIRPHPWGMSDMIGNLWEYATRRDGTGDPVIRGGSYFDPGVWQCRAAYRSAQDPTKAFGNMGFRLCFSQ